MQLGRSLGVMLLVMSMFGCEGYSVNCAGTSSSISVIQRNGRTTVIKNGVVVQTPEKPPGKQSKIEKNFPAMPLVVSRLGGFITEIKVGTAGSGIAVSMTGPSEIVEVTNLDEIDGKLHIYGPSSKFNSRNITVVTGGKIVQTNNFDSDSWPDSSTIVVDGVMIRGSEPARLTIQVPLGTSIEATGQLGDISIGDTHGQLIIDNEGSGNARIGKVTSAEIKISGSGDIVVAEVGEGTLVVNLSGSGDVTIATGEVQAANITSSGSGDVTFGGKVGVGNYSSSGSGDISIASTSKISLQSSSGSGDIYPNR